MGREDSLVVSLLVFFLTHDVAVYKINCSGLTLAREVSVWVILSPL